MFSLIITIISIALVAALAIATIYYGGSAFTQGTAKANASALVAAAQQVTGALTLYANDNGADRATDVKLVPTYLSALPAPGGAAFTINPNTVTAPVTSAAVCTAIATSSGSTGALGVALTAPLALADDTKPYTCAGTTAVGVFTGTFTFKG